MNQSPQYQELQYLRDELNQMLSLHCEHANKTINMVLLVLGGVCVIFGKDGLKLSKICLENIPSYFMIATALFISNLILYYTARRYYNNAIGLSRLSAYITVFYEKRPSEDVKAGDNFCWETVNFEITANGRYAKSIYKRNAEYMALTVISVVLMFIFLVPLVINIFRASGAVHIVSIIVSLVYVTYLAISIYWLRKIPNFTYSRNNDAIKIENLKTFIQYALDTGHDTEETLKDRLGCVWSLIYPENPVTKS